jgi:hypothetical protein
MVDHNVKRLFKLIEPNVIDEMNILGINQASMVLYSSTGYDGTTNKTKYNQKFENEEQAPISRDANLFITTVSPLHLTSTQLKSNWTNVTPQSVRYCRPKQI